MDKADRLGFKLVSARFGARFRSGSRSGRYKILIFAALLVSLVLPVSALADWEPAPVKVISENELSSERINELASLTDGPVPDDVSEALLDDEAEDEKVILNADRVYFNDETGAATAEGDAVLTYGETSIHAERIDYDAETQKVEALSLPNEQVLLTHGTYSVKGERLNYDLVTNEGVLTGTNTKIPAGEGALYVHGDNLTVVPWELAVQQGLVPNQKGSFNDYVAQWHDVALTTCALEHPHYRLESKTISFIPGRSVIAKKPKVYLGNTYLFTSPFDYVMGFTRRATRFSVLPYVQHNHLSGGGAGITGIYSWETGSFAVGVSYSDRGGFGWLFELEQELNDEFSIKLGTAYSWDEAWDESIWRPYGSLIYARNGWLAALNWSKDEYISDQKDSVYKYKGRLDRKPELVVNSPWFKTSAWSWLSFNANIGSYNEQTPDDEAYTETKATGEDTLRAGLELHGYFERDLSPTVQFFSNTKASAWYYDRDDADQEILWNFTGFRYNLGNVELGTAYERRFTWGESAMLWDQYRERQRIHQKLRFNLGGEIYTLLRASYDLDESMLDEAFYCLQWITDCMKWDLYYLDDRTSDGNDKIGLTLSILAFPNTRLSFGQNALDDPFEPPEGLKK